MSTLLFVCPSDISRDLRLEITHPDQIPGLRQSPQVSSPHRARSFTPAFPILSCGCLGLLIAFVFSFFDYRDVVYFQPFHFWIQFRFQLVLVSVSD
jgi:hypothetical protein